MSTYSRVRSDPMTVLASPPAPRSISTSTKRSCGGKGALSCCACRRCAESDASRVGERRKEPPSKTVSPPMAIVHCPRSSCGAALPRKEPTAPTMRPTLGSLPATAVLTSGELTTALPTPRASSADGAPRTATRSTCVVPSPLRATSAASWSHTRFSAASNSASASSRSAVGAGSSTRPLEKRTSESEVDWSASMDMQLKEASAAAASMRCSSARGTATSVSTKESMVAMSGSIMPAPLAVPTMEPPAAEARRSLGYRSVVMMARAAGSMLSRCSSAAAAGTASAISPTGSRQPITPVEAGSTDEAPPGSESASAAAAQTASESPTPSLPEHTFEILLLTTMACRSPPAASRFRPTVTGAPQKAFLVKTAAQLLEGASATMSVRFIVARVPSAASAGEKRKPAVPTWKPDGSVASAASACSYSLVDEKERICAVVARPVAMRRVPTRLVRAEASQSTIFVGVGE
mmetsp:Transcript_27628/g.86402  ORF Transcript_27628/g.86402 Transcript_27628/m.86402 type:complete len:464 (-) Transcript_27628:13-1404(-)